MHNLLYFLKEAFINFKRNWPTSLGAVITIFLSLLVIGVFMVGTMMVQRIVDSIENQVSIQVFIADDASDSDVQTLTKYIEGISDVSSVTYKSKDEALADFTEQMTSNPEIIDALDGSNPLPASLQVELSDTQKVEEVANQIQSNSTFLSICDNPDNPSDSVKYGQQTVERLFRVTNYIRYVGIAVVILLVFVTFIFINNTIRLAIMARRREIAIMRLVGASNGFIRGPFLMETLLEALLGALLAIGGVQLLRNLVLPKMATALSWLPLNVSGGQYAQVYLLLVAIGLVIGVFGSALAMRRYLKV